MHSTQILSLKKDLKQTAQGSLLSEQDPDDAMNSQVQIHLFSYGSPQDQQYKNITSPPENY